ncbi:MAG: pyridoxine 5'-phosphate synthase [Pseudomonadota bacterium]|nr:pyridoxine 5'-phosphate synthase [Pseudomonadota bacterium]
MRGPLRLGVNIDHVATIRNARGGLHPDPLHAAKLAESAGADGITAHLREDRRHISDDDIRRLTDELAVPLNLEMAPTDEMLDIALRHKPQAVCIVPEKREEVTTEGGLDVVAGYPDLEPYVKVLGEAGSLVSLFIDPDREQVCAAAQIGVPVIEIHTGAFCDSHQFERERELQRIVDAAALADELGLECHAGHGLTFDTVTPVAKISSIVELNIGHFLIGEAIFGGLESSIKRIRVLMDQARSELEGARSA